MRFIEVGIMDAPHILTILIILTFFVFVFTILHQTAYFLEFLHGAILYLDYIFNLFLINHIFFSFTSVILLQ